MSSSQPYEYRPEPDLTGFLGSIADIIEQQNPWERCTLSALTPGQAAERIGRDLFAEQAHRFAREVITTGNGYVSVPVAEWARRAREAGAMSESAYREELDIETPYSRGGFIPGPPVKVVLALDECVVCKRDGRWQCVRADPGHVATERHGTFPRLLNWYEGDAADSLRRSIRQRFGIPERPTE